VVGVYINIVSISNGVVKISLRVHPGAARSEVVGVTDGVLQVRVAAPPVKGKANKELIDFLSRHLSVAKSRIAIVSGHTAKDKVIAVSGLSREEVTKRLSTTG
jgi:uncharacterized protein (TIGR00251 family)